MGTIPGNSSTSVAIGNAPAAPSPVIPPPPDGGQAVDNPNYIPPAPDGGQAIDNPTYQAPTASAPQPDANNPLAVTADPDTSLKGGVQEMNALGAGIGEGVLGTANGAAKLLHLPHATLQAREDELARNNSVNPAARDTGLTSEAIAEFAMGDEALKGLTASEKFAKAAGLAKTIENSPLLTRVVAAAIRGGIIGGVQGGVKTDSAVGAVEGGAAGAAGGAATQAVPAVINAGADVSGAVSRSGAIQDTLQNTIRKTINDAASEAGVNPSNAASIRDVAQEVSDSMLQKAKSSYADLDAATGGRFQRFSDAIKNVQQKLRDVAGIDPEAESSLIEKLNNAQDAHDVAMQEAEDAGLPKDAIAKANASFKQSKAMLDLSKQIQASSEGLRPEMADAANRPVPETVSPTKLNPKLDKMINSGRIQQAIGPERTTALRTAANDAQADTQTVKAFKSLLKKAGYTAGTLGVLGGGYDAIHHLIGE